MKSALTIALAALTLSLSSFAEYGTKTDNTKMNEKTHRNDEVTSQDQGSSPEDVQLTQHIRQDVLKQNSFSTSAKNVKIVSMNGNVVLKGPVKTMAEKQKIESIAKQYMTGGKLYNEITIAQ